MDKQKFLGDAGLAVLWSLIKQNTNTSLSEAIGDLGQDSNGDDYNVKNYIDYKIADAPDKGLGKLTFGSHVYDGTQDVTVSIYDGKYE